MTSVGEVRRPRYGCDEEHVTLCELLDRVLNKGIVVMGEVTISVADIDLVYLALQVVLTSVEKAKGEVGRPAVAHLGACMQVEGTHEF